MAPGVASQPPLIDTDTLSLLMRRHPQVVAQARIYRQAHARLTISIISRYEILRGLGARDAPTQIAGFNRFCEVSAVLPLTEEAVTRAASIYADLYRRGELIGDADILIAATALVENLVLVTNNERHFRRVAGLAVENWAAAG